MTSRELVIKALTFQSPPRIPRQLWTLPWAEQTHPEFLKKLKTDFPDDIVSPPQVYRNPLPVTGNRYEKGIYIDEWGCRFENVHGGVIGIVHDPLISHWSDLERLSVPEELLDLDVEAINRFCSESDLFVLGNTSVRPFERFQFMRTMVQAFMDLVDQPPELESLLQMLHCFYMKEIEAWLETDVDGLAFMDDWGTQQSLLISPDLFRKLFLPMYRDYAKMVHDGGKFIFMHSDGFIMDIIPDLIEVGIDALNSQIFCMDLAELGNRFRGKITFWGEMDRQELLPRGDIKSVQTAVKDVYEHLYADGGIIAQCEFGPGAKPENVFAVMEAWKEIRS